MAKKTTTSKSTRTTSKRVHRSAISVRFVKDTTSGRFVKEAATVRNPGTTITERNTTPGKTQVSPPPSAAGLPDDPDEETIERLAAEAEQGVPSEKLRRRGRPSIGEDASSSYSVRLPVDLVTLTDERSALDGVSRGETIRRALIEYLTK